MLGELDRQISLLVVRKIDVADLKEEGGSMVIKRDKESLLRSYDRVK